MAQRRSGYGDTALSTPASPMTPKGGSGTMYGDPNEGQTGESPETFRRRTTPITGAVEPRQSSLQEILAMLNGGQ